MTAEGSDEFVHIAVSSELSLLIYKRYQIYVTSESPDKHVRMCSITRKNHEKIQQKHEFTRPENTSITECKLLSSQPKVTVTKYFVYNC